MAMKKLGDACAYIPQGGGKKALYVKIGAAFIDEEDNWVALKLDSIPIPGSGWTGWINIFNEETRKTAPANREKELGFDDDIPF